MAKNSQPKLRHYILLPYGIKMPISREEWQWKLLIRMPDFVTSEIVEKAKKEVFKRKSIDLVKEINLEVEKCNMKTSLKN